MIDYELINSAHDCSEGGLSIAIAESAIIGNIGAKIYEDIPLNWEEALFGETQSRIIVTTSKDKIYEFEKFVSGKIPYKKIGEVTGEKIIFGEFFEILITSFPRETSLLTILVPKKPVPPVTNILDFTTIVSHYL